MEKQPPPWTLGELAAALGAQLVGPPDFVISRLTSAESDDADGLAFVESAAWLAKAEAHGAGALIVGSGMTSSKPHLIVAKPREAFGLLLHWADRPPTLRPGIDPRAAIDPSAKIGEGASIGPFAVIEANTEIGAGARVFPFSYVGEGCILGERATLMPHVVLYPGVRIGARSTVHAGTILGADGFGYYWDGAKRVKVPQVGGVVLGNDVEIGALTAVDRATAGDTKVGDGVKIDNFVQVGHNVRIGEHTVIAGLTGIAGSARIGARNTVAGRVDFADHVSTCDDVTLGGRTGVAQSIEAPGAYLGTPAQPALEGAKNMKLSGKLTEFRDRIRQLEQEVKRLKGES